MLYVCIFFLALFTYVSDGTVLSQLTINRVSWDDGGTYSCLAREIRPGSQVAGGSSENEQVPSKQEVQLDIYAEPTKVSSTDGSGVVESSTQMSCTFQVSIQRCFPSSNQYCKHFLAFWVKNWNGCFDLIFVFRANPFPWSLGSDTVRSWSRMTWSMSSPRIESHTRK